MEDNFSTDRWQAAGGEGLGGNVSDGERQMKLLSLAAHLLLCSPVPNRPRTSRGPWPRGWGPLLYKILSYGFESMDSKNVCKRLAKMIGITCQL